MRTASAIVLASLLAGTTMACGGDDTTIAPHDAGLDGASDVGVMPGEGGSSNDASDSSAGDAAADGGDAAACNFATFVLGLVSTHTNNTDQPSTDLGQSCVDDMDQAEFKSLFP